MNWERLFQRKILDRGFEYYEDGHVIRLEYKNDEITAQVDGSDIYDVVITLKDNHITGMYCSCPYADDGHYCKHMAAVLFYFDELFADEALDEERGEDEPEFDDGIDTVDDLQRDEFVPIASLAKKQQQEKTEVMDLIAKIPEAVREELLAEFILADDNLRNKLQMQYDFAMNAALMKALKAELNAIPGYHSKAGYVDWYHANEFTDALAEFLDTKVQMLIARNCLKEAFELTNEVFYCIGTIDMDDSDGGLSYVADKCYEYWKKIARLSDDVFKKKMTKWFETHKTGYVYDFLSEYMEEILLEEFATNEMLQLEIQKLDVELNKNMSHDCGFCYSAHSGSEKIILKRIEYMKRLHCTDEEIEQYRKANRRFFAIRELEIAEAIEQKDYHTAIRLLAESKALDVKYPNQVEKYMKQLIDLYEKTDAVEDYCAGLKEYLLHFHQYDLTYVKKLKVKTTDVAQWNDIVDEIVQQNYDEDFVSRLLYAEQRYEQLMQKIEHSRYRIRLMDAYEKVLRKRMPERVINIYVTYLEQEAERANDRNQYRRLMDYLKKIAKCEGGETAAKNIAEAWKQDYKRRTAMMDELRKAGF